jgi:hypothetical protein
VKNHRKSQTKVPSRSTCSQQARARGQSQSVQRDPRWKFTERNKGKFPVDQLVPSKPTANSQQPECPEGTPRGEKSPKVSRESSQQINLSPAGQRPGGQRPEAKQARGQIPQVKNHRKSQGKFPVDQLVPSKPTANSQKPECPEGTPGEKSPKVSRESSQQINLSPASLQ